MPVSFKVTNVILTNRLAYYLYLKKIFAKFDESDRPMVVILRTPVLKTKACKSYKTTQFLTVSTASTY